MNIPKTQAEIHYSTYMKFKRVGVTSALIIGILGAALLVLTSCAQEPVTSSYYFSLSEQNIRLLNTVGLYLCITGVFILAILSKYDRRSEVRNPARLERYDYISKRDETIEDRYDEAKRAQKVLQDDWQAHNQAIELKNIKKTPAGELCSS